MNKKVIDYEVIYAEDHEDLMTKVKGYLRYEENWQPFGPPSISVNSHTICMIQAVVKYEA